MRGYLGLAELVVTSPDPERLVDFYEVACGFVFATESGAWRTQLGQTCLVIRRGPACGSRYVWQVDDLEGELGRLRARGLAVTRTSHADAWGQADYHDWSAGFTDADGNSVELVAVATPVELAALLERRFGRGEEARRFAASQGAVAHNPQFVGAALEVIERAASFEDATAAIAALWGR